MIEARKKGKLIPLLILLITAGIGWNFWLPTVEDYLNLRTRPDSPPNIDFFAYFNAGNRFENDVNPYYWADTNPDNEDFSDFLYPPTVLPLFELLSRLSYNTARYLWFGIYSFAFLLAFLSSLKQCPPSRRMHLLLIGGLLLLTSYPLLLHIRNGQMDVFIISLILLSHALYLRNRSFPAAFLLAAAALIKISPAFLLIFYFLYKKDFRFLVLFSASAAGMVLLSLIRVPFNLYVDYFMNILPAVSGGTSYWLNQSIIKLLPEGHKLAAVLSFTGLAALSLLSLLRSQSTWHFIQQDNIKESFVDYLFFVLNLLVILAFAGKIWSMAYVWMILPSAVLLTRLLETEHNSSILIAAGTAILLMNSKVYGFPLLESLNLLGNITMSTLLVFMILHTGKNPISGPSQ